MKDIAIATLAAVIILRLPCFAACDAWQKGAVCLGIFMCLLFFCLFCEEMCEKWQNRKDRIEEIRRMLERLRGSREGGGEDG